MHGGAEGSGAPRGARNGRFKGGMFTCEAVAERRAIGRLLRTMKSEARRAVDSLGQSSDRVPVEIGSSDA